MHADALSKLSAFARLLVSPLLLLSQLRKGSHMSPCRNWMFRRFTLAIIAQTTQTIDQSFAPGIYSVFNIVCFLRECFWANANCKFGGLDSWPYPSKHMYIWHDIIWYIYIYIPTYSHIYIYNSYKYTYKYINLWWLLCIISKNT